MSGETIPGAVKAPSVSQRELRLDAIVDKLHELVAASGFVLHNTDDMENCEGLTVTHVEGQLANPMAMLDSIEALLTTLAGFLEDMLPPTGEI